MISESRLAEIEAEASRMVIGSSVECLPSAEVLALVAMARYANHKRDCRALMVFPKIRCDCGFEEAMK